MASTEYVYLNGGPDDGVVISYQVPPDLPSSINYSGSIYNKTSKRKTVTGLDTFVYDYAGPALGAGVSTPHAHSGYHDLQHTMQHKLPSALGQSGKLTGAALRRLGAAHRVRG